MISLFLGKGTAKEGIKYLVIVFVAECRSAWISIVGCSVGLLDLQVGCLCLLAKEEYEICIAMNE